MMKDFLLPLMLAFIVTSLSATSVHAQTKVTGTVVSAEDKAPIAGATVVVRGTTTGTTTDAKGNFALTINGENPMIEVNFMGFNTGSARASGRPLNIMLTPSTKSIEEVVVIGYGTVAKSDLTGSVSKVSGADIAESRQVSLDQALAGRVAGVQVAQNGGEPGGGINIQIRGTGSLNASSDPLYVVDGFPVERSPEDANSLLGNGISQNNPLAFLNPNDVESIEILKDASATAIYGSRGANGVVLITTKSGREGAASKITFSSYLGFEQVGKKIDVLSGEEYANFMYDLQQYYATPDDRYVTGGIYGQPVSYADKEKHNWQKELFRNGINQNYDLSVSGGWQGGSYAVSSTYTKQNGTVTNSAFDRLNLKARVSQQVKKWFRLEANANYSTQTQDGVIAVSGSGGAASSVFQQLLTYRPINVAWELDDNDGSDASVQRTLVNPKTYLEDTQKENRTENLNFNMVGVFTILKDLSLRSTYGIRNTDANFREYHPTTTATGKNNNGQGVYEFLRGRVWVNENTLSYNKKFNNNHRITSVVGFTMEQNRSERYAQKGQDYAAEGLGLNGMSMASRRIVPSVVINKSSLMSFLGRVNYTMFEKYLFTASLRVDGSSKFSRENRFSYFPSGAFAWKVSEEEFIKNLNVFHNLKLRTSYGVTGNQAIPAYCTMPQLRSVYYSFNSTSGTFPSGDTVFGQIQGERMANPDLKWETTYQYDAGIDMEFFRGRLAVTADVYFKETTDMLMDDYLPHTTGYRSMYRNVGTVTNRGFELSITSTNINTNGFMWNTSFNFSMNRNKIKNLGSGGDYTVTAPFPGVYSEQFIVRSGAPIGSIWGFVYDGVYTYSDFEEFYNTDGSLKPIEECRDMLMGRTADKYTSLTYDSSQPPFTLRDGVPKRFGTNPMPGMMKYKSLSGGDDVTLDDRTIIGQSHPDFYGGFSNTFKYKNIDLSVFATYSYGNEIFVGNYYYGSGFQKRNTTQDIYNNMWFPHRENSGYPVGFDTTGWGYASSMNVEDASFIKIKDVTLGYTFPNGVISKLGIQNLRIYVSGQNLLTFTDYKWGDPETSFKNPLASGFENFSYPTSRRFLAGLSLTF